MACGAETSPATLDALTAYFAKVVAAIISFTGKGFADDFSPSSLGFISCDELERLAYVFELTTPEKLKGTCG